MHGPVISEEGLKALGGSASRIAQGILLAVGVVSTVFSIAGEYAHGQHFLQSWLIENVSVMGAVLHLVLILLILFPGRLKTLNDDVANEEVRAVAQCLNQYFVRAWTWIWVCFGLMYSVLLFKTLPPEATHSILMDSRSYASVVRENMFLDVFNVGSTLFIYLLFYFLTPSFIREHVRRKLALYSANEDKEAQLVKANAWVAQPEIVVAYLVAAGFVFFLLLLRLTTLCFPDPAYGDRVVSLILGWTSALALAAFAGRVDSKFIRNWQWVVPFLFIYALIQGYTSVLYDEQSMNKAVFTYSAFTLKCIMFIFISNFFETRKAIYYAHEIFQSKKERSL